MTHTNLFKSMFICLSLWTAGSPLMAQDSIKTVFHLPKLKQVGFYFAPEYQYGQVKNTFTSFSGFGGGLVFNQKFSIGLSGQQLMNRDFSPSAVSPLVLRAGYMGLKMEYTIKPTSAVHISFPLTIGSSMVRLDSAWAFPSFAVDSTGRLSGRHSVGVDQFFFIQPGVMVEANLFKYMKVFAGVNYRYNMAVRPIEKSDASTMNGLSFSAGVKLGWYDINLPLFKRKSN